MPPPAAWDFAPFRLDPATGSLWRHDQLVPLPPKPLAVLTCLVEQAGQMVTKEVLLDAVWPGLGVTEGVLKGCIRQIRQVLGQTAGTPQYIVTVHRRGYRFVAPVTPVTPAGSTPTASTEVSLPSAAISPDMQSAPGIPGLIVGRATELAQLQQRWVQACQGVRQVVFISGEAGIGKTTLVDTFVAQIAAAQGIWLGRGQCIEQHGTGEAYLPLLEALGRLGHATDGQRLVELLRQYAPSWLLHLPALVPAIAFAALERRTSGTTRARMLRELAEAVAVLTIERPMVLVLEDLHWSDLSTLDWLAYVARRREPARLLVVGTFRPTEALVHAHPVRTVVQDLQLHGHGQEVALDYLPEGAVVAYLTHRFGSAALPAGLARYLHQRTTGNPLFLVTLVNALLQQGVLQQSAAGWELAGGLEAVTVGIPQGLRQLVSQQVDQLPQAEQLLLEAASVAGKEFAVAAVAAAVDSPVDEVERRCTTLARRGQFVRACGTDNWPDGTMAVRFGFLHDLYRDTVYDRLPAGRRTRWHRQVAARLEQGYGTHTRDVAAELAMHFLQGRAPQQAIPYLQMAGETALRRSAPQEAITTLTHGLTLLQQWPDTRARAQQELPMQMSLGTALMVTKGWGHADVGAAYTRARTLCEQLGDSEQLFAVLAGVWEYANGSAQHTLAQELGARLLAVARERAHTALLLQAYQALWTTALNTGAFAVAYQHLQDGLALYSPLPQQNQAEAYGGHDLGISIHSYAALILWYLGYADQARHWNDTALALARELAHPFTLGHTLVFAAWLAHFCRDVERTQAYARETLLLGTEQGSQYLVAVSTALLGWVLSMQGQESAGLIQLRQGFAAWEAIGTPHHRPWFLACLAETLGRLGRVDAGLTAVAEALEIVERTAGRKDEATLYRLQGELLWQAGYPFEAVETCLQQARRIARQQHTKPLELRAAMSLSRLWQQHGKVAAAREVLGAVYHWFSEGFDTVDLQEATGLLEALAV
jgi:DNA-binding winged helix-turn-helix (wHTH) protein/tetratricopeptide (TPR) repeat protein